MNLLSKFSSIEIKPDARISETDRTFCQAHQAAYDAARASLQELEFFCCNDKCFGREFMLKTAMKMSEYGWWPFVAVYFFSGQSVPTGTGILLGGHAAPAAGGACINRQCPI